MWFTLFEHIDMTNLKKKIIYFDSFYSLIQRVNYKISHYRAIHIIWLDKLQNRISSKNFVVKKNLKVQYVYV